MNHILQSVAREIDDAVAALQKAKQSILDQNKELPDDARVVPIPDDAKRILVAFGFGGKLKTTKKGGESEDPPLIQPDCVLSSGKFSTSNSPNNSL